MWKIRKIAQFKKQMQNRVLDATKKEETKENLIAYIKMHPVRKVEVDRLKLQTRANILFFNKEHMYAKLATILILLSGTGTAFAAENTIPGDALYNVKVNINENVRGALAISSEAKSNWEAQVAERRLDEASKLAAQGKLTAELETKLESKFTEQTQKIKDRIAKLQETGKEDSASELSTRLQSALQIHSEILDTLNSATDTPRQEIKPLLKQLKEEVESMKEVKSKMDDEHEKKSGPDIKIAAQNHMNMALKQIEKVKELVNSQNDSATSSATTKLEAAEKAYNEGKISFEAQNYNAAFLSFGSAQRLAAEARIITHVEHNLKIDEKMHSILKKVDERKSKIEEIFEEKKEKIEDKIKTDEKRKEKIKNHIEKIEDKDNTVSTILEVKIENTEDTTEEKDN